MTALTNKINLFAAGMMFVHIIQFLMNTRFSGTFAVYWLTLVHHILDILLNMN
jgi:hypothetical protein